MNETFIFDIIILVGFVYFIFSRFFGTKLPKDDSKKGPGMQQRKGMGRPQDIDRKGARPAGQVVEMPRNNKPPVAVKPKKPVVSPEVLAKLEGAERLKAVDPTFDEKTFLSGCREAFNLYWQAAAEYDEETLDALTSPRAYDDIMDRIEPLEEEGRMLLTRIDKFESITLAETRVNGRTAIAEVKYEVEMAQSEVKKNTKSTSSSGKPYKAVWVWARNIDDPDPNWELEDVKPLN